MARSRSSALFRPNPLQLVCEALGIDDLSQRQEYATLALQMQNRAQLGKSSAPVSPPIPTAECIERWIVPTSSALRC